MTRVDVEARVMEYAERCEACSAPHALHCRIVWGLNAPFVLWLCRACKASERQIVLAWNLSERFYPGAAERMAM